MPNKRNQDTAEPGGNHKDGHHSKDKKEEKSHRLPHVGNSERKQAQKLGWVTCSTTSLAINEHVLPCKSWWSDCIFILTHLLLLVCDAILAHRAEHGARDTKSIWGAPTLWVQCRPERWWLLLARVLWVPTDRIELHPLLVVPLCFVFKYLYNSDRHVTLTCSAMYISSVQFTTRPRHRATVWLLCNLFK